MPRPQRASAMLWAWVWAWGMLCPMPLAHVVADFVDVGDAAADAVVMGNEFALAMPLPYRERACRGRCR